MSTITSFGPDAGSIFDALRKSDYSSAHIQYANSNGVSISTLALVEFKLWMDFCRAAGSMKIKDTCIVKGRNLFFNNVVKFLGNACSVEESLRLSQLCASKAGVAAASAAGPTRSEIDPTIYEQACEEVQTSQALKPVCDPD